MTSGKVALAGLSAAEISESLGLSPAFRGRQVFRWIGKGAESFGEMTDIGSALRAELEEKAVLRSSSVSRSLRDGDGTEKLQIALQDGLAVEAVLLTDRGGRRTACLSCQVGCAMGCAFCQTGRLGFARNLSAGEIVEQFLFLEKRAGPLDNIVFMGMGEPMMNLPGVRKAVAVLTDGDGRGFSARRITLSTSGVVRGIYDLADNGPAVRLAVSLTTADEALRGELMPVARANPLGDLREAIVHFTRRTGRRVTLEAALLHGKNTGDGSAENLVRFAKGLGAHVNLIPWNPVEGLPFEEPTAAECARFMRRLNEAGLNATLRARRGRGVGGACGQLGKTLPGRGAGFFDNSF